MYGRGVGDVTADARVLRQSENTKVRVRPCVCARVRARVLRRVVSCRVVLAVMGSLTEKLSFVLLVSFIQLRLTLTGGESRTESSGS